MEKRAMNPKPLISVIVPVYNVKEYVSGCINSVLKQSYETFELFLIDDGSTDGSGEICDSFLSDNRVKVIHKPNGGLSDARNTAIDQANGEYIVFIDSDDYVSPQYLELLYEAIEETHSDIACCEFLEGTDLKFGFEKEEKKIIQVCSGRECLMNWHDRFIKTETAACGKLYSKALFADTGIRFPIGRVHEDMLTTHRLFEKAGNVCFMENKLYYYFIRPKSISNSKDDNSLMGRYQALTDRLNWFKESEYEESFGRLLRKQRKHIIYNFVISKKAETKKYMSEEFNRYCDRNSYSMKVSFFERLLYFVFRIYRAVVLFFIK